MMNQLFALARRNRWQCNDDRRVQQLAQSFSVLSYLQGSQWLAAFDTGKRERMP